MPKPPKTPGPNQTGQEETQQARISRFRREPARVPDKRITPRMVDIFLSVARYRFLTTDLLARLHRLPPATLTRDLRYLFHKGYLTDRSLYGEGRSVFNAPVVHMVSPQNRQDFTRAVARQGAPDLLARLDAGLAEIPSAKQTYSPFFLTHELGVSRFFVSFEEAIQQTGLTTLFWERLSGVPLTDSQRGSIAIRPDGFFGLRNAEGLNAFFFLEYDRSTRVHAGPIERKMLGYKTFAESGQWEDVLDGRKARYGFTVNRPRMGFRVLFVTDGELRRDFLLRCALKVKGYKVFHIALETDLTPERFFAPVWLRGKEFSPVAEELAGLPKTASARERAAVIREGIARMPRVSLVD